MHIFFQESLSNLPRESVEDIIKRAFIIVKKNILQENMLTHKTLEVQFVDALTMQSLNARYRNKDAVTDVLSFSYQNEKDSPLLGQIVLCEERLREQASFLGHSLEKEAVILFFHGVLHIMGFDHETEEDYLVMKEKEDMLMEDFVRQNRDKKM